MECWLLGSRVKVSMRREEGAEVLLSWRPLPGFAPVLLAKKRFPTTPAAGLSVRPAGAEDAPAIRGMYAMTGGRGVLLPVRDGLWTADRAWMVDGPDGRACAYCVGSEMGGVWNVHEWGMLPETDEKQAISAVADAQKCRFWQIRAEFAPEGGEIVSGECVYLGVAEPFLLGTEIVKDAAQLASRIEAEQR